MRQRVLYRFRIRRNQLTRSLQKYCDPVRSIWVECEFDNVDHIPPVGARVGGCGFELRVFDVQFYLYKVEGSFGHRHSVLVECLMTGEYDYKKWENGEAEIIPRKRPVTKRELEFAKTFGWKIDGLAEEVIS